MISNDINFTVYRKLLTTAMDNFFKKHDASELRELENKIYDLQSKIRHLKLNATITGIGSIIAACLSSLGSKGDGKE